MGLGALVRDGVGRVLHKRRELRRFFHHDGVVAHEQKGLAVYIDHVFAEQFPACDILNALKLFADKFDISGGISAFL